MNAILRLHQHLLGRFAIYRPNYSFLTRARDGRVHGVARIGFHASWAAFAAALTILYGLISVRFALAHPFVPAGAAVLTLFGVKVLHVVDGTYYADPLDWLCDVGSWGTAGALGVAQLVFHAHVSPIAWPLLAVLYLLTYAWATP